MASPAADTTALSALPGSSVSSAVCSAAPPASCLEAASPAPYSLSQQTAEHLYAAVEAKAVLEAAKEGYEQALASLDALVDAGALPEKGLPVVNGMTLYRQEGRISWSYPDSIKELEAQVKKRKQLAEQLGEATQKRGKPFWTIKPAEPLSL